MSAHVEVMQVAPTEMQLTLLENLGANPNKNKCRTAFCAHDKGVDCNNGSHINALRLLHLVERHHSVSCEQTIRQAINAILPLATKLYGEYRYFASHWGASELRNLAGERYCDAEVRNKHVDAIRRCMSQLHVYLEQYIDLFRGMHSELIELPSSSALYIDINCQRHLIKGIKLIIEESIELMNSVSEVYTESNMSKGFAEISELLVECIEIKNLVGYLEKGLRFTTREENCDMLNGSSVRVVRVTLRQKNDTREPREENDNCSSREQTVELNKQKVKIDEQKVKINELNAKIAMLKIIMVNKDGCIAQLQNKLERERHNVNALENNKHTL